MPTIVPCMVMRVRSSESASPKSPIFAMPVVGEPDVARLEVAVDDAVRVRVLQPLRDLRGDPHGVGDRQAPSLRLVDQARQLAARHVLADDVRLDLAAGAGLLAGVEDGDDVRVVAEPPHRLRLAADARDAVGVEAVRLDRRERDVAVELRVVREVDALAPALAEEALDVVAAAGEGGGEGGRRLG